MKESEVWKLYERYIKSTAISKENLGIVKITEQQLAWGGDSMKW